MYSHLSRNYLKTLFSTFKSTVKYRHQPRKRLLHKTLTETAHDVCELGAGTMWRRRRPMRDPQPCCRTHAGRPSPLRSASTLSQWRGQRRRRWCAPGRLSRRSPSHRGLWCTIPFDKSTGTDTDSDPGVHADAHSDAGQESIPLCIQAGSSIHSICYKRRIIRIQATASTMITIYETLVQPPAGPPAATDSGGSCGERLFQCDTLPADSAVFCTCCDTQLSKIAHLSSVNTTYSHRQSLRPRVGESTLQQADV